LLGIWKVGNTSISLVSSRRAKVAEESVGIS